MSNWSEMESILRAMTEPQLEERWIRPILKLLGWEYEVQDRLKKRGKTQIPDYSLFESTAAYKRAKGCMSNDAYFSHTLAVGDAKAIGVPLDGEVRTNANPSYQIVRYMEDTGKTWGILTDGLIWRLYSLRSSSKFNAYYEVDLERILASRNDERFKYFFNVFRRNAFVPNPTSHQSFLDVIFEGGEQYAQEIEKKLKVRAFKLVELLCKGFSENSRTLENSKLNLIYEHSLYFLFRLMFILNCEAKGLLKVSKQEDYFIYSLRALCKKLKEELESNQHWTQQARSYNYILDLFELLSKGDNSIGIHGFGEEILAAGDRTFYKNHPIPDTILNTVLIDLACSYDRNDELKFIDYKRLSVDHLGSLFEGLLEYQLTYAPNKLVKQANKVINWSDLSEAKRAKLKDSIIEKGELFLSPTSDERAKAGAFYTPTEIVDEIVSRCLAPLVKNKSVKQLLEIRIIDPAMGSGPFLLGAIRYLEEQVLRELNKEDSIASALSSENIRWQILNSCIYGVDINRIAVELAKFSFWIYSAQSQFTLKPLSEQLKHLDSLSTSNNWKNIFECFKANEGFDAVVGNPPWGISFPDEAKKELKKAFPEVSDYESAQYFMSLTSQNLLRKDGCFGLIVPNTVALNVYASDFRRAFASKVAIDCAIDLSNTAVFEDPSVRSMVYIGRKGKPEKTVSIIAHAQDGSKSTSSDEYKRLLEDENWAFFQKQKGGISDLVERLGRKSVLLSDYCEVRQGYIPYRTSTLEKRHGQVKAAQIVNDRLWHSEKKEGKDYQKELQGKDVERFSINWSGTWVKYGDWVSTYLPMNVFSGPRILIREITNKPPYVIKAAITDQIYINNPSVLIARPTGHWPSLPFILGILNSKVSSAIFLNVAPKAKKGLFPKMLITDAKRLFVPRLGETAKDKKIHDSICDVVSSIEKRLKESPAADIEDLSNDLDELAYQAFQLTPTEITQIENYLSGLVGDTKSKR